MECTTAADQKDLFVAERLGTRLSNYKGPNAFMEFIIQKTTAESIFDAQAAQAAHNTREMPETKDIVPLNHTPDCSSDTDDESGPIGSIWGDDGY